MWRVRIELTTWDCETYALPTALSPLLIGKGGTETISVGADRT